MSKSKHRSLAFILIIIMMFTTLTTTAVTITRTAAAQSIDIDAGSGFAGTAADSNSIALWIPPKMLTGEKYSGVVTVTVEEGYDRDVLLVSESPDVIRVSGHVTINANMHQAVFDIEVAGERTLPRPSVTASVSAVMSGGFVSRATAIAYDASAGAGNTVRLLAFSNTAFPFARVVVVPEQLNAKNTVVGSNNNSNDDGTAATETVTLVYPGGMMKVAIDDQKGYGVADVPLPIVGDNRISVFDRPGDSITVTRIPADPAVMINATALSTIPAWTPEWGYLTSWVLVDATRDGKPVRGDFEVTTTSSNPDVVDVEKERTVCQLPCAIPIRGHSEGSAHVGVYVTGIGSDTMEISTVLPVRYGASPADLEGLAEKYIAQAIAGTPSSVQQQFAIDSLSLSNHFSEKVVSSQVTDDDSAVYGIIGHYAVLSANYTLIEVSGNTTILTPGQLSKAIPLVVPYVRYHVASSDNSGYGDVITAEAAGLKAWHYNYFNGLVRVAAGHSEVIAGTAPATARMAAIGIGSSHAAMSSFAVRLDEPVGPAELKGELTVVALEGSDIRLAGYVVDDILRGYAADVVGNKGVFTSSYLPSSAIVAKQPLQQQTEEEQGQGQDGGSDKLSSSGPIPADIVVDQQEQLSSQLRAQNIPATRMEVDVPPLSYPAEGFVFAAHIVTQDGLPVRKVSPLYELGRGDAGMSGKVQEIDSVFIHDKYVETIKMKAVMNAIDIHVNWPDVLKLDRRINMAVTASVAGARVSVSGEVRGELVDVQEDKGVATVALYPVGAEGDRKVVVSVTKQGWVTATAEKVIPARKYETLTIDAAAAAGAGPQTGDGRSIMESKSIHVPFTIAYSTIDDNSDNDGSSNLPNQNRNVQKAITGITPYILDERPLISRSLTFGSIAGPAENNGTRYAYTGRMIDAGDSITGLYERQVQIAVIGGSGSGYYSLGQVTTIEAGPDRQVLGFAVVEKFSHWEYDGNYVYVSNASIRSEQATIMAPPPGGDVIEVRAVYVTDYSVLAVMVISTVAAVGAYAYRSEIRTMLDVYRKREGDDAGSDTGG